MERLQTSIAARKKQETPNDTGHETKRASSGAGQGSFRFRQGTAVKAELERQIECSVDHGHIRAYPLHPRNEIPTLLARLPIFPPVQRQRQKTLVDKDNAWVFNTAYGSGRRHGPPLTVRDEDTLIAILRRRDRRLYGESVNLPIPLAPIFSNHDDSAVEVHCVVCTVRELIDELRLAPGGKNFPETIDSVKRLGGTRIEITVNKKDRYFGKFEVGTPISLIDVQWKAFEEEGVLFIQIPPLIVHWLEREYTYLNWEVRLKLNDLGKALHRYLSSQMSKRNPRFTGDLAMVAQTIGYAGPKKNLKVRFEDALNRILDTGWIKTFEISGTGRSKPLRLHVER